MEFARGAVKDIETNIEIFESRSNDAVVFIDDIFWAKALFFGTKRDRRSVFIRTTNKCDVVGVHAQEAHKDVCGQINSGDVS